jgi:hypothetical protein
MSLPHVVQPPINIGGLRIDEPVTTLTDILVTLVCFYAYRKLSKDKKEKRSAFYFKYFFLMMGFSTLLGGLLGHAFQYYFGFIWKTPGWVTGMCSVAFIERGAIMQARGLMKPKLSHFFSVLNIAELVIFLFVALYSLNFFFVEIHASYGLLEVFLFELYVNHKIRDKGSRIIMLGVIVSTLAALTHMSRIPLFTWFNYTDLSHILMACGAYVFYLGMRKTAH